MEKRRFGRTEHMSTVAIFGGAAFWDISQADADRTMELIIESGVNHIDVAPQYGVAEERIGTWMKRERQRFFVGCKTMERTRKAATAELHRSLNRLKVDHLDLYQIHAITSYAELDEVTAPGGTLETLIEAQQQGLTRFLGITGHGVDTPAIFLEALRRFDFDSVLFPLNYIQYTNPIYRKNTIELLRFCQEKDVGTMVIKTVARGNWGDRQKTHITWYQPFSDLPHIQKAVDFALSQPVTGLCMAGDIQLTPLLIEACENFTRMRKSEQEAMIASVTDFEPLFI
jgi:aryl-alcohol dehydrogenase-like predicted oxidoreductase